LLRAPCSVPNAPCSVLSAQRSALHIPKLQNNVHMEENTNKTPSRRLSMSIATFLGIGFSPFMPGTLASLVTACIAYVLARYAGMSLSAEIALFLFFLLSGLLSARDLARHKGIRDPKWFVMDEVAGMWMALIALPKENIIILVAVFLVFRLCDIFKPWIIGKVDRMEHYSGIMLDDILAAVPAWLTGFILWRLL